MSAGDQVVDRTQRLVEGWVDYRRRQWAAGLATIGFIPLTALVVLSVEMLTRSDDFVTLFVAPLPIIILCTWCRFILFRCPNCGGHFHLPDAWRLTNGRRCPHCGLERYQAD